MQLPAVSLYVVHVLFKSKVGTLGDELNVICFSNISIISDSYLSNKFGIMSGTLFSLMDSGAVLSRYDDGTQYKCNIPNFQFGMLYIGHSCISYFIAFSFCDPPNPKQLKDPQRELGIFPVFHI